MHDWCDLDSAADLFAKHPELQHDPESAGVLQADGTVKGGCPQWSDAKANAVKINRKTVGWNAAAAAFAYGYGKLALEGWKLVGADQLIGGPWPVRIASTALRRPARLACPLRGLTPCADAALAGQ